MFYKIELSSCQGPLTIWKLTLASSWTFQLNKNRLDKTFYLIFYIFEFQIIVKVENQSHHPNYWMPMKWACSVAKRARKENRIKNDYLFTELINQIDKFRAKAGALLNYDWVPVPLVYTQVRLRKT